MRIKANDAADSSITSSALPNHRRLPGRVDRDGSRGRQSETSRERSYSP